jgi:hypothetical protein
MTAAGSPLCVEAAAIDPGIKAWVAIAISARVRASNLIVCPHIL